MAAARKAALELAERRVRGGARTWAAAAALRWLRVCILSWTRSADVSREASEQARSMHPSKAADQVAPSRLDRRPTPTTIELQLGSWVSFRHKLLHTPDPNIF